MISFSKITQPRTLFTKNRQTSGTGTKLGYNVYNILKVRRTGFLTLNDYNICYCFVEIKNDF